MAGVSCVLGELCKARKKNAKNRGYGADCDPGIRCRKCLSKFCSAACYCTHYDCAADQQLEETTNTSDEQTAARGRSSRSKVLIGYATAGPAGDGNKEASPVRKKLRKELGSDGAAGSAEAEVSRQAAPAKKKLRKAKRQQAAPSSSGQHQYSSSEQQGESGPWVWQQPLDDSTYSGAMSLDGAAAGSADYFTGGYAAAEQSRLPSSQGEGHVGGMQGVPDVPVLHQLSPAQLCDFVGNVLEQAAQVLAGTNTALPLESSNSQQQQQHFDTWQRLQGMPVLFAELFCNLQRTLQGPAAAAASPGAGGAGGGVGGAGGEGGEACGAAHLDQAVDAALLELPSVFWGAKHSDSEVVALPKDLVVRHTPAVIEIIHRARKAHCTIADYVAVQKNRLQQAGQQQQQQRQQQHHQQQRRQRQPLRPLPSGAPACVLGPGISPAAIKQQRFVQRQQSPHVLSDEEAAALILQLGNQQRVF